MDEGRFDEVARRFGWAIDRRALAGGALAALGFGAIEHGDAKKNEKKCKKPKVKCGTKCCAAGANCLDRQCVTCPTGSVFCEDGCQEGDCCFAPCSGSTCCPQGQLCTGGGGMPTACECVLVPCGDACCESGQSCNGGVCGTCPTGTPICAGTPCGIQCACLTSVDGVTACASDSYTCNDCADDDACSTLLGVPALCIAGDCLGCSASKACTPAACPSL